MNFTKWNKLHSLNADILKVLDELSELLGQQIDTGIYQPDLEEKLYKKFQSTVDEYEKLRAELYGGGK